MFRRPPEVFLGSDALAALDGTEGLLLGEKRHRQVDVFGLLPVAGGPDALAAARFDGDRDTTWPVVGVAVADDALPAAGERLLDGLVAGDLVVVGAAREAYAHNGESLTPCSVAGRRPRT